MTLTNKTKIRQKTAKVPKLNFGLFNTTLKCMVSMPLQVKTKVK